MISTREGATKLALFQRETEGSRKGTGFYRLAFRVGANGFVSFIDRLGELQLTDDRGRKVTKNRVVDHGSAFSIYFCDPYGYNLEITTYEHAQVVSLRD